MSAITMKSTTFRSKHGAAAALLTLLFIGASLETQAVISEPDNILYGSVVIGTTPVTAEHTDVVIEAQRIPRDEVIASYRMGSDTTLGSYYALKLKVESIGSSEDPEASQTGQILNIVLRNAGGVVGSTTYQIAERGRLQRVDFGAPIEDADGNGLPDLWELTYLNTSGVNPNQQGANGNTVRQNYIAGTNPEDPGDVFSLQIDKFADSVMVSFLALRAEGVGYADKSRFYTLESNNSGGFGAWTPVPGYVNLVGDNQTVAFTPMLTGDSTVYRGSVRLAALQTPGSPRLTIQRLPGNLLRLSWPSASPGFSVQENGAPQGVGWTGIGLTPSDDGTNWSLTLNAPQGSRFYRLVK